MSNSAQYGSQTSEQSQTSLMYKSNSDRSALAVNLFRSKYVKLLVLTYKVLYDLGDE